MYIRKIVKVKFWKWKQLTINFIALYYQQVSQLHMQLQRHKKNPCDERMISFNTEYREMYIIIVKKKKTIPWIFECDVKH